MPDFESILPDFSHEETDAILKVILGMVPGTIHPQGFIAMLALIDLDLDCMTVRWHGLAEGVSLNEIGKEVLEDKKPLVRSEEKCGSMWKVLEREKDPQTNEMTKHPDLGYYQSKMPMEGPLKDHFVAVTKQQTKDSFLMPLFNVEGTNLIGVFAVDSEREDMFRADQKELKTLVSFVRFLENVVNSIHIAYYDYLCRDTGVFNRNYLNYLLKKALT